MGIVHFATVGTSPGAVTSALAYLKKHYGEYRGDYTGGLLESVVVFCSREVDGGSRPADEYVWNSYGHPAPRQGWQKPRDGQNVIAVIQDFLRDERYGAQLEGGHLYVWPLDVHDFETCLTAIATATLAMARGDATGKYVWAHLTGGTNVLNAAIVQAASFSGLIGRLFYTFLADAEDRKFLLPPSEDPARWRLDEAPVFKTRFDAAYYRILHLLQDNDWHTDEPLLNRLKQDAECCQDFQPMNLQQFRTQYLNRMDGREIERERRGEEKLDRVRIAEAGREILRYVELHLLQALVRRGDNVPAEVVKQCRRELDSKKRELG